MPILTFINRETKLERELQLRGGVYLERTTGVKSPDVLAVWPWPFRESEQHQRIQVDHLMKEIWNGTNFPRYFFTLMHDDFGKVFENGHSQPNIEYQAIASGMLVIKSKL